MPGSGWVICKITFAILRTLRKQKRLSFKLTMYAVLKKAYQVNPYLHRKANFQEMFLISGLFAGISQIL